MDKAKELFEAVQNGEFDFAFSEYSADNSKTFYKLLPFFFGVIWFNNITP